MQIVIKTLHVEATAAVMFRKAEWRFENKDFVFHEKNNAMIQVSKAPEADIIY